MRFNLAAPHSLRTRLLWFLLAAITLTAVAQTWVAYRTARAEADEIFDYHMQQMAMALRSGLPSGGTLAPRDEHHDNENADFLVQVWSADGLQVYQSSRGALPDRAVLGFSNIRANGSTYRVFSMQTRSQVIQVAQDMSARREMAGTLALRTAGPIVVMAPLLMLLVWWVVSTSLAPVSRARRQVAERQADDLTAISEAGLPDEIRPLVHELNLLFGRVRQAFDAQKSFVADAAHELRSPLSALKLQVEGLKRAGDDAAREVAVTRLCAGIERATRLVEQLLVMARQQASAAAGVPPEPVTLGELAAQAVSEFAAAAQARAIDLGLTRAEAGTVSGYPEALRVLLRNLLDNAIKYTPGGGTIDVQVRRADGALVLEVDDSGPGIREEDRERVLERFYRVAGTESTGSGLGLAIVRAIADLHGATLSLEPSMRLGGLQVRVRFPSAS